MVNRKSVEWRRAGEKGPRPWEVSEQAEDNVDVITQELTGKETGINSASGRPNTGCAYTRNITQYAMIPLKLFKNVFKNF